MFALLVTDIESAHVSPAMAAAARASTIATTGSFRRFPKPSPTNSSRLSSGQEHTPNPAIANRGPSCLPPPHACRASPRWLHRMGLATLHSDPEMRLKVGSEAAKQWSILLLLWMMSSNLQQRPVHMHTTRAMLQVVLNGQSQAPHQAIGPELQMQMQAAPAGSTVGPLRHSNKTKIEKKTDRTSRQTQAGIGDSIGHEQNRIRRRQALRGKIGPGL